MKKRSSEFERGYKAGYSGFGVAGFWNSKDYLEGYDRGEIQVQKDELAKEERKEIKESRRYERLERRARRKLKKVM